MNVFGLALAVAATVSTVAAATEREPEALKRSGKWLVEYDTDGCHLLGQFGSGDAMVVARFTRYQPGDGFDLALYGKRLRSQDNRAAAKVDFGLRDAHSVADALNGSAGTGDDKLPALFLHSMRLDGWKWKEGETPPAITPEQEAKTSGVTVAIRGKPPFRLEFGSLAKPFAQMRDCSAALVRSWGYDPEVQANLLRRVEPVPGVSWFRYEDYPVSAMRKGQSGIVQVRIDVDPAGAILGCNVIARTSPDEFADITCKTILRRAQVTPALDAQGKPVRSYYLQKLRWMFQG